MTSTPIRWGVIGTGNIARRFAGDLAHSSSGVLAAVGSRDGTRAFAFTADFGSGIHADETAKILARPDIDAIYVGTVNRAHHDIAMAALEAGKPVLVEKPIAPTPAEAKAIRDLAERRGLLAMEAMWMVFTPGIIRLKALIAGGAIGAPKSLSANLSYARAYRPGLELFDAETGGALPQRDASARCQSPVVVHPVAPDSKLSLIPVASLSTATKTVAESFAEPHAEVVAVTV